MVIAVASGKGGTGKTTVAVSLALALGNVQFFDCDLEEPNAALFIRPHIGQKISAAIPVPEVDESACTHCRKCAQVCAYGAIAVLGKSVTVFPQLCHGCGGCAFICPENAITENNREIGIIERGMEQGIEFIQGTLNIGEPMAAPIIKQELRLIDREKIVILDSPPGTSCPVIETVRGSDFCILVTEPTPFGLNDLKLAVGMVRELAVSFGVIINCAGIGDDGVEQYCTSENIPVLLKIPWDRRIAESYSRGEPAIAVMPELKQAFNSLYNTIISKTCT